MKNIHGFEGRTVVALAFVALAGCGAPGGDGSGGEETDTHTSPSAQPSIAEQVVLANARADRELHLLTRKFVNNDTEVVEFYEPGPGQIVFSAAGSPTAGTVLHRNQIEGKTASEVWAVVAPGEPIPDALVAAITRSRTAVSDSSASELPRTQPALRSSVSVGAAPEKVGKSPLRPESSDANGYCASQFWTDWGNWGSGNSLVSETWNYGWNETPWGNITGQVGYIVCPQGNVSNTGGTLTVVFPAATSVWAVAPNYYRWTTAVAGENCGFNVSCWAQGYPGGYQCTPVPFQASGKYVSDCYANEGTSCGDDYDWLTWASTAGSYCESQ